MPCSQPQPAATVRNRLQSHTAPTPTPECWHPAQGRARSPALLPPPHHSTILSLRTVSVFSSCGARPALCSTCRCFLCIAGLKLQKGHPLLFSALSTAQTHEEVLILIPSLVLRAAEVRWCTYMLLVVTAFFSPKHRP